MVGLLTHRAVDEILRLCRWDAGSWGLVGLLLRPWDVSGGLVCARHGFLGRRAFEDHSTHRGGHGSNSRRDC